MKNKYDVVIVGGGLFGCSVAYNLCKKSNLRIAIIERGLLGMQTSSLAASLVTRGRSTVSQTQLCIETFNAISDLENILQEDVGFNFVGSLHVAQSNISAEEFSSQTELLKRLGDHPVELTIAQAEGKAPWLKIDHADYIVYNDKDGFVDPYRLCAAYMRGAKHYGGVDVFQSTEVLSLLNENGHVSGVQTDKGDFHANQVVLAAGPWVNSLLQPLGSGAAMAPVRSNYWMTETDDVFPMDSPVVILPEAKAYARPEVGGLLFGLRGEDSKWVHPTALPDTLHGFSFDEDFEGWQALENSVEPFLNLCPSLNHVAIEHYISGPSAYTPDGKQLIGNVSGLEGVYLASGCCGIGVAISGGVGSSIASLVMNDQCEIDLTDYDPKRFGDFNPYDEIFLQQCALSRSNKKAG